MMTPEEIEISKREEPELWEAARGFAALMEFARTQGFVMGIGNGETMLLNQEPRK